MTRARSPAREQALKIWLKSQKQLKPHEIADQLGITPEIIRKWKSLDKWDEIPLKPKRRGAPEGNQNAVGNSGGSGAPDGNEFAIKHGFFSRIMPEEALKIAKEIEMKEPIDMLWDNIVIQYTAIARAQKIMFVRDQEDETRVLKKEKHTTIAGDLEKDIEEFEWEYQHAWDKHATFMKAQSGAMSTLQSLIRRYDEMLNHELVDEEKQLRVQKLKLEVKKITNPNDGDSDDKLIKDWVEAVMEDD